MAEPTLLYCVGATKAGTSWLYSALQNHPECHLRAVKETHYWDSFAPADMARQVAELGARLRGLKAEKDQLADDAPQWRRRNLTRSLRAVRGLSKVISGSRADHRAYLDWLSDGAGDARLIADMTPSYALLPPETIRRMLSVSARPRVIFLIRDPLARLWSHVRMQANRQNSQRRDHEAKANDILWRVLNKGEETHMTLRGDYIRAIEKLRSVVPQNQLMVEFAERMFTPEGWDRICAFLDIAPSDPAQAERVHEGKQARMREDLEPMALRFLKDQYDWVSRNVAPLPQAWQDNLARASA